MDNTHLKPSMAQAQRRQNRITYAYTVLLSGNKTNLFHHYRYSTYNTIGLVAVETSGGQLNQ